MSLIGAFPNVLGQPNWRGYNWLQVARRLGLETSLAVALDVGDAESYDGSAQTIADLVGSEDFYLGATSGAEASDPTFNGTSGRRSSGEYFSYDGGDWHVYTGALPTWANQAHKDNAALTVAQWFYPADFGANQALFATTRTAAAIGTLLNLNTSGRPVIQIHNGGGGSVMSATGSTLALTAAKWNFVAWSWNEATAFGLFAVNAAQESFTSTYSSPSASDASFVPYIGARGTGDSLFFRNGSRWGGALIWTRALAASELQALFCGSRGRFSI